MSAAAEHANDVIINRDCIGCDTCGTLSPQSCCSSCLSYYYCNRECQLANWKEHRGHCKALKRHREDWKERMEATLPNSPLLETIDEVCAICLEESIQHPVTLDCGHIFCYSCLGQYQKDIVDDECTECDKPKSCPCCRREISGKVWQASAGRSLMYLNRAHKLAKGSAEQKKYAELSFAELEAAFSALCGHDNDLPRNHASFLYRQAEALSLADKPKEMLDVTKKILSAKKRQKLDDEKLFETNIWMAEAYLALGEFANADDIYKSLGESDPMDNPHHFQLINMGECRTCYELGEYDFAIFHGQLAIRNNRGVQGVHKYVALAQKAKGDIDAAKTTMSRAILYEPRWDEGNLNHNKKLLAELQSL